MLGKDGPAPGTRNDNATLPLYSGTKPSGRYLHTRTRWLSVPASPRGTGWLPAPAACTLPPLPGVGVPRDPESGL